MGLGLIQPLRKVTAKKADNGLQFGISDLMVSR